MQGFVLVTARPLLEEREGLAEGAASWRWADPIQQGGFVCFYFIFLPPKTRRKAGEIKQQQEALVRSASVTAFKALQCDHRSTGITVTSLGDSKHRAVGGTAAAGGLGTGKAETHSL